MYGDNQYHLFVRKMFSYIGIIKQVATYMSKLSEFYFD